MLTQGQLIIGNWYSLPNQPMFELVAYDATAKLFEIQFFDGTVTELEMKELQFGGAKRCASPVDIGGAFEAEQNDVEGLSQDDFNEGGLETLYQQGFAGTANHCGAERHFREWTGEWE